MSFKEGLVCDECGEEVWLPRGSDVPVEWLTVRRGTRTFHFCGYRCLVEWGKGKVGWSEE